MEKHIIGENGIGYTLGENMDGCGGIILKTTAEVNISGFSWTEN